MDIQAKFAPIRTGLLEFLVLRVIDAKPSYAADILTALAQTDFATQEGTLYPLLSKLRREEWVGYEWVESSGGPPRKYYSLTKKGEEQLKATQMYWQRIISQVKEVGK